MKNNWFHNVEILELIFGLRNAGYNWESIFSKLMDSKQYDYDFKTPENIRKRFNENKYRKFSVKVNKFSFTSFDEAYNKLCKYIGKTKKIAIPKSKDKNITNKKILVIADTHIPFHNIEALQKVVDLHRDSDRLVIAGDFLDCYSVSKFTKEKYIPLREELVQATSVLNWLASIFPQIDILGGNHTDRPRKYFEQRINPDLMFLVQYDLMSLISKDLPNVNIVNDLYSFPLGNGQADIAHFIKIGRDLVIGHFEMSSKIFSKAANDAYNWLKNWEHYFKMGEINLFIQGHTHRLSKLCLKHGIPIIGEAGSMCKVQDYMVRPDGKYNTHLIGYWIVYQNSGKTDLNESNPYLIY